MTGIIEILSKIKEELEPLSNLNTKHVGAARIEIDLLENTIKQTKEMMEQTKEMRDQTNAMRKQTKWLFWTFLTAIIALVLNIVALVLNFN